MAWTMLTTPYRLARAWNFSSSLWHSTKNYRGERRKGREERGRREEGERRGEEGKRGRKATSEHRPTDTIHTQYLLNVVQTFLTSLQPNDDGVWNDSLCKPHDLITVRSWEKDLLAWIGELPKRERGTCYTISAQQFYLSFEILSFPPPLLSSNPNPYNLSSYLSFPLSTID